MRIGDTIYLDHQATTPVDSRVLDEMIPYFTERFGNPHSADHSLGWEAAKAVDKSAARIASLIGADADEIVFTSGATESNNLALFGMGRRRIHFPRQRIVVSAVEHKSVLATCRALQKQLGYDVKVLEVDSEGLIDLVALERSLSDDVLLVSVMAVNSEVGTIQDVEQISRIVRDAGALFHCDAAQAPCAIDVSRLAEYTDLLSLSGHKMYGPKGVGALYIRRDLQDQIAPIIYGGGQQNGLRSGTVPAALCVGMGAAAAHLIEEGRYPREELRRLRDKFVREITALPWEIMLNGPQPERRHPGNANLRFSGYAAHDLLNTLQPHLAASMGSACTSGIPEPSYVLSAIGLTDGEAEASIRFSIGRYTRDEDIEEAVKLIGDALSRLAGTGLARSA